MTSPEQPDGDSGKSPEEQLEELFASSDEAATYSNFLKDLGSNIPPTDQDFEDIRETIIKNEYPVICFVLERLDDPIMQKALSWMIDPSHATTCSEMVEKLIAAYKYAYPDIQPNRQILQDVAVLDTIEEITWYTHQTEEDAIWSPKDKLQSKILANNELNAAYKQLLLQVAEQLVAGKGIDFSDPDETFAKIEERLKEEREYKKRQTFTTLFRKLGENYNVTLDPEFSVLMLVTSLSVCNDSPHIPDGPGTFDQLRLLGIPYDVYKRAVERIIGQISEQK